MRCWPWLIKSKANCNSLHRNETVCQTLQLCFPQTPTHSYRFAQLSGYAKQRLFHDKILYRGTSAILISTDEGRKDLSDVSWWSANEVVLFYPLGTSIPTTNNVLKSMGRINPSWKMDSWATQSFKEKPVLNSVHHLWPVPKLCLWSQQMQIWTPSSLMHLKWNRQKDSEYILIFRTFLQKVRKISQCPF